jgi:integrase
VVPPATFVTPSYSYQGHQYRVPLDAESESEAITKGVRIRVNPLLTGADPLAEEIKNYLADKQEKGTYTRNSADSRAPVLKMWAKARNLREVREINTDEIKVWLNSLRRRKKRLKESSIESYGTIIRGFCAWLVEGNKLQENPAAFIKAKISTSAKERRFCRREQVDLLISECVDRELKFILYCGFHAGLRKGEIVQARPQWFDLKLNIIHITESETWKPKDKDKRTIPLTTAFKKFLEDKMAIDGELPEPFLVYPTKVQGKSRYRYDFRKPFEEHGAKRISVGEAAHHAPYVCEPARHRGGLYFQDRAVAGGRCPRGGASLCPPPAPGSGHRTGVRQGAAISAEGGGHRRSPLTRTLGWAHSWPAAYHVSRASRREAAANFLLFLRSKTARMKTDLPGSLHDPPEP